MSTYLEVEAKKKVLVYFFVRVKDGQTQDPPGRVLLLNRSQGDKLAVWLDIRGGTEKIKKDFHQSIDQLL